jgi:hypothetical protein
MEETNANETVSPTLLSTTAPTAANETINLRAAEREAPLTLTAVDGNKPSSRGSSGVPLETFH